MEVWGMSRSEQVIGWSCPRKTHSMLPVCSRCQKHVPLQLEHNKSTHLHIPYNCSSIIRRRDKPVDGYNIDVVQWNFSIADNMRLEMGQSKSALPENITIQYIDKVVNICQYKRQTDDLNYVAILTQLLGCKGLCISICQYTWYIDADAYSTYMEMYQYIIPSLNETME